MYELDNNQRTSVLFRRVVLVVALVVLLFALLIMTVRSGVQSRSVLYGQMEIEQVTQSLYLYATDHSGQFPTERAWITALIQDGYLTQYDPDAWIDHDQDGVVFTYNEGCAHGDSTEILIYLDPDRWQQGVWVGFADGRVEFLTHESFNHCLEAQLGTNDP